MEYVKGIVEKIKNGSGIHLISRPLYKSESYMELVKKEFDEKMNTIIDDGKYKFGKAYRSRIPKDGNLIQQKFDNDLINNICKEYFQEEPSNLFKELFWCHEYRSDRGIETNGFVHFDKIGPTLKFFLYVNDVEEENGPFHYMPDTRKLGCELRENNLKKFKNQYNLIDNKINSEVCDIKDMVSITGKSGTMFVFDSDMFHCGGNVKEGYERKVLRLHIRRTQTG
jgi:hypothetical protein